MPNLQKKPRRVQGSLVAHVIQDKRGFVTKHKTIFWHSTLFQWGDMLVVTSPSHYAELLVMELYANCGGLNVA